MRTLHHFFSPPHHSRKDVAGGSRGLSALELVLVIGITFLVVGAAIPLSSALQRSSQLNENTTQIIQTLRIAKMRAQEGLNNSSHGVYFEINAGGQDRVILYQGASFATRVPSYDRTRELGEALSLSTTLAGSEVNFSKGFGTPTSTGTVVITHAVQGTRTISVNGLGMSEIQ